MSAILNNRYRILQTLGSGGCGKTFLAEDTHMPSRRRCVIKQLKPATTDPVTYQIIQERFQREAAILETLGRANDQIPALYAYFTEDKEFYLVQDWIEGKSLMQKVREEGVFSETEVKRLLAALLPVLDYVHSQGIIHRDIKPENIMLREQDTRPFLIDFGAVKEVVATVVDSYGTPTSSIVIGSPGFMPLEQAAGKPVFASDLYSLGLTAIYSLTGKRPQELTEPLTGEVSWHKYAANISSDLAAILDKTIKPLARERYRTAKEMLEALQSVNSISDLTVPAKRAPNHDRQSRPAFSPIPASGTPPDQLHPEPIKQSGGSRFVYALILILAILFTGAAVALFHERNKNDSLVSSTKQPEASPATLNLGTSNQNANGVRSINQTDQTQGRFSVAQCGSIKDKRTNLEWMVGPDRNTTWPEARQWVTQLGACGGGWRMPTIEEIRSLYNPAVTAGTGYFTNGRYFPARIDPVFNAIGGGSWVWSNENAGGDNARAFNLNQGKAVAYSAMNTDYSTRAFAVRNVRN
jgi:serine/threonine-protein kinase